MTVTASRLGSSPITLDWSNLARVSTASSGAWKSSYDPHGFVEAWEKLKSRFRQGEVGFYDTPVQNELSQHQESDRLAKDLLQRETFTDCLFLGIGGSALGPVSLLSSLEDRRRSQIRFHFVENPDPTDWQSTIQSLKAETTLVCVVTKSGTTFETIAQFLLALQWLGKDRLKTHVVAITDPARGDLRAFATQEGIPTLSIAPSIGGRFSIFSPVGLFAAALAGLSTDEFMHGAKQIRDYMEKAPPEKNALFILSHELLRHSSERPIHVCMPYSTRLRLIGDWFVQLWGESLGKDGKGFTPLAAVGATDQHSILQLLRDGPNDKVTLFMTVDRVDDEVRIPKVLPAAKQSTLPSFQLLEGHTLHELMQVEYRATSLVLSKQNRPNATLQLDCLDERNLGALYYAFSVLTAVTGTMMGINPFDQPGVEEGKIYIRESLSRSAATEMDADRSSAVSRLRRE